MACKICRDRGWIRTIEFDGPVWRFCPACSANPMRAQMAREFGSDRQRQRIADGARRRPMAAPRRAEG